MARSGPIVIGDNNIVEERAEILNEGPEEAVMILGSGNLVGAGARVASLKMGNSNVVEAGARVGRGTVLSYGCVLTAGQLQFQIFYCLFATALILVVVYLGVQFERAEVLPEMTVIYSEPGGGDLMRGRASSVQQLGPELQLLAKILPNHHQVLSS